MYVCVTFDPSLCSVNKLYAMLDELGSLDDSWREVCSNLRALSTQTACTDINTRWLGCQSQGQYSILYIGVAMNVV